VVLATDLDREGEAIAWHLAEVLGARTYQRATFNAITRDAVRAAIASPRALNLNLVNAQQARRVLDRVVGYAVSPTCKRGVGSKDARSAGRVQSVAVRLVAERELEIRGFTPTSYFVPTATLRVAGKPPAFKASLVEWKGEALGTRLVLAATAEEVCAWCRRQRWVIARAERHAVAVPPPPPFITSTLQQAASVTLKHAPAETMKLAQALYEGGHITYMRTDSTAVSPDAAREARAHIAKAFPPAYLPGEPPAATRTAANAQEAHEAIRPTAVASEAIDGPEDEARLYRLIWERFVASQMAPGRDERGVVDCACAPGGFRHPTRGAIAAGIFRARGTTTLFDGWRRLTADAAEERSTARRRGGKGARAAAPDPDGAGGGPEEDVEEVRLPALAGGEDAELVEIIARSVTTKAPARYSEAALIKLLERRGVGRPSTYAAIMATILARGYVALKKRKLHATDLGIALTAFLRRAYAGNFIEPEFTNRIEDGLDAIAKGERAWEPFLAEACREVVALARRAGLWYDPLAPAPARASGSQ
jgi:DNA topoisomerase-1